MRDKRANYGVCKANFILAQKETKNVSHMSPKSGQSVPKNRGDQRYIGTLASCLLLYALCLCFTLSSTSFMLPNHHSPPSIAYCVLLFVIVLNIC